MGQADQIATLQEQLDAANEGIAHRDALMVDAETTVRCLIDELTEARAETQEAFEQLHAERQLAMDAAEVAAHELRVTQSEAQDALQRMADMMDLQQQQHEAAVKELNAAHFRQSAQWQQRYNASEQSLTSVRGDLDQAMCSLCLKQGEVQRLQATVDDLEAEKLRSNAATERTRGKTYFLLSLKYSFFCPLNS
jgi:transcription-repair coupling factor (superfamily II helicase)